MTARMNPAMTVLRRFAKNAATDVPPLGLSPRGVYRIF
jgi:hypothetical protein